MTQWHPLFAQLLRPLVEGYFEVETNVPVGDLPREADLVLLRRTSSALLPFQGLWKHLTTWNVLEYKGPTVAARLNDIDLLVELGLGIHRRLNEERAKREERNLASNEVSWWLLAHSLGNRFLRQADRHLGPLEAVDNGIWRSRTLHRLLYLVSGAHLPVERDTLPLHILERE